MPNTSLSAAIQEVYALAPSALPALPAIEIQRPDDVPSLFLVKDSVAHDFMLETGDTENFIPAPFRFKSPAAGANGVQELNFAVDAVDRSVMDFFADTNQATLIYRLYLPDAPTEPQLDPPLVLTVKNLRATVFEVTGRAVFADIVNYRHLREYYDRQRFPGLRG